ncbi:heterokaryon incompatibility protein-domain-containing protein [Cadophora sp. MPI-SDFR-AT-0126]|nr:heterokaryon incompatibility protein-domain-containing protein [Leotiomycetes sp. MPI-SDFR-AT-0126]
MLCEHCERYIRRFEVAKPRQAKKMIHHSSRRSLKLASKQGCIMCRILYGSRMERLSSFTRSEAIWSRAIGPNFALILEIYTSKMLGSTLEPQRIVSQLNRIFPYRDRLRIDGYRPTEFTGSDACFSLAKHWIDTCRKNHTTCKRFRRREEHEWKPTRLIKVDLHGNNLKLCTYDQLPSQVEYVTLSHCWGETQDECIKLTDENIESFQKELPDLQQAQTFKDAITATRMLGFEYIWIDSLCIIQEQENKEDWSKEASQMSSVYKYSTCNITATSAKDDTGGCFFDRKIDNSLPARITVESTLSRPVTFDINCLAHVHWNADVENAPVNKRGWVLQERLLSPRLLHYTENQLYWECNELLASESYPWGFSNIMDESEPSRSSIRIPTNRTSSAFSHKPHAPLHAPCAPPSNIQVARELHSIQQSDYLAGLWKRDLIFELGWISNSTSVPSFPFKDGKEIKVCYDDFGQEVWPSETRYIAPSWTWASLEGAVTYPFTDEIIGSGNNYPLIHGIEPWVKPETDDFSFGRVTDGHLRVLAQIM